MELATKVKYAKKAIESITRHDDASLEERTLAANELRAFIDDEIRLAQERESAKARSTTTE